MYEKAQNRKNMNIHIFSMLKPQQHHDGLGVLTWLPKWLNYTQEILAQQCKLLVLSNILGNASIAPFQASLP